MVTLYLSQLQDHKKKFSIHQYVSFLISKMNYLTHQLLHPEELKEISNFLNQEDLSWEDGKKTAGTYASIVKNNLQLSRNSQVSIKLSQLIRKSILSNQLIKSFTLPKQIHGVMFTKSSKDMHY